jgi:hypothetical protein
MYFTDPVPTYLEALELRSLPFDQKVATSLLSPQRVVGIKTTPLVGIKTTTLKCAQFGTLLFF